jgi:hypothetical protein
VKHWLGKWLHADSVLDIDWQKPWFKQWAHHGEKVEKHWQLHPDELHRALNQCLSSGVDTPKSLNLSIATVNASVETAFSFVPQQNLLADIAYESFIFQHRHIPTRNHTHDFFNGLCWLRFPKSKAQLNRLQALAIAQDGVSAQRGALRDALTLFDENAALFFAPPVIWEALQHKQWLELFVNQRDGWQHTQLVLFGHALLEKLSKPYKGITAHVLCVPMPDLQTNDEVDAWLCQQLTVERLLTKPFVPLPLSGIPGWWAGNQAPAFFEDKKVFRD